ncbi:hypothetical protein OOU_Y34scaffold00534g63 [Pyricularia oryzae Y34]|uniref:Uncharacterized protein n=2 Tax=Pyricularia oryzae TaxID=318829 RepID=A0AA97PLA8_PYRO3|nr:hypothetical protein OOU_Y34scaffold00534g63 [Pyricularia oryzae Y34]
MKKLWSITGVVVTWVESSDGDNIRRHRGFDRGWPPPP